MTAAVRQNYCVIQLVLQGADCLCVGLSVCFYLYISVKGQCQIFKWTKRHKSCGSPEEGMTLLSLP